jgi:hypothetical protein
MTFNEDQLRAYIKQTAWEVGNEVCDRLEKRIDEKIKTHSLECKQSTGLSAKAVTAIITFVSGVIVAIIKVVETYFTKGN